MSMLPLDATASFIVMESTGLILSDLEAAASPAQRVRRSERVDAGRNIQQRRSS